MLVLDKPLTKEQMYDIIKLLALNGITIKPACIKNKKVGYFIENLTGNHAFGATMEQAIKYYLVVTDSQMSNNFKRRLNKIFRKQKETLL